MTLTWPHDPGRQLTRPCCFPVLPRFVLATRQAYETVAVYKKQNESQRFCNFILKVPSKLLNGCNLVSVIHCQSPGNSLLSGSTETDNIPIPSEVDRDGSRHWAPRRPWRRRVYKHPQNTAQNGKFH